MGVEGLKVPRILREFYFRRSPEEPLLLVRKLIELWVL